MESAFAAWCRKNKGRQKDLAEYVGVNPPAVSKWQKGIVPASRVLDVEQFTGVSRYRLRPDVFGRSQEMTEGAS